jgi:surface protein
MDNWNMSQVASTLSMFEGCTSFNQNINSWQFSSDISVTHNFSRMFSGCTSFNQPLSGWTVSRVTSMTSMFADCVNFNQNIDTWDTPALGQFAGNLSLMFKGATSFNQPLNHFTTVGVNNFSSMFSGATSFNQPLNNWALNGINTSGSLSSMFQNATNFNQDLTDWCVTNASTLPTNFATGSALQSDYFPCWGSCGCP